MKRDCACPRARHQHGTAAAYLRDGCRCFRCRYAKAESAKRYREGGTWRETEWPLAVGTGRRLQALAVIGWSARALAAHCTISADHLSVLRGIPHARVSPGIADEVARLYRRFSGHPRDDADARRCATQARRYGWASPLAWSDAAIDDPDATPDTDDATPAAATVDHALVDAICAGTRRLPPLTRAPERIEAVRRLATIGLSDREISDRLGVTRAVVLSIRRRKGIAPGVPSTRGAA